MRKHMREQRLHTGHRGLHTGHRGLHTGHRGLNDRTFREETEAVALSILPMRPCLSTEQAFRKYPLHGGGGGVGGVGFVGGREREYVRM